MGGGRRQGEKESSVEKGGGQEEIKVMFMNAQSVVSKMDELRAIVAMEEPGLVAVTEAWTHDEIGDAYLKLEGYDMIVREDRNDTQGGRGGGLLLYAKKNINAWRIRNDCTFNQMATVGMKCGNGEVLLHLVYRSPNSSRENDALLIQYVSELRGRNVLIGDFNYPDIRWTEGTAGARGRPFLEVVTDKFMEQHVNEATHSRGNTLDLILSDQEGLVSSVATEGRLGKSDHDIVTFDIEIDINKTKTEQQKRNFSRGNYETMRNNIGGVNWENERRRKKVT